MSNTPNNVLLFDGVCNLCNGLVQFIIRRDSKARFRFASLQSRFAQQLLSRHNLSENVDTVLYLKDDNLLMKSNAVLAVLKDLGGVYTLSSTLKVIPKGMRDAVYDWVARNRYRWFGQRDECMVPTPNLKKRFID